MEVSKRRKRAREDRISALPDELIYRIFSFLDMIDVVKTCLLSNKWQYLWMSTPTLTFDTRTSNCDGCGYRLSSDDCEGCRLKRDTRKNFVTNVLALRTSNIVKFQLHDFYHVNPCLVYTWLNVALARRVQDVDITVIDAANKIISLPHLLFSSKVKVLRLRLRCKTRVPNSICAAVWIKNLDLEHVTLPEGNTNGELDLSFPMLESLKITECHANHLKIISISTPVLESLEFSRFSSDKNTSCKVKTRAPNLKSLTVHDSLYEFSSVLNYCMEDLSSLVSADICFWIPFGRKCVEECIKCLSEAVIWMYNVQDLKLRVSNVQHLVDCPELLERLPGLFTNLKHVKLDHLDDHKIFHARAVLKFLGRAPHLETLILEGLYILHGYEEKWPKEEEWTKNEEWIQSLPLFNRLVTFEIRNFSGVEMRFLEFVLEKSIVLKKLIIKTSIEWLQDKANAEISSFFRASSSVSILFKIE